MSVYLSPIGGAGSQFFDNNGVPLAGGKLYTYAAGTTTPKVTFTSVDGITQHTNPIILDSAGRIPNGGEVWLSFAPYKFILKTSTDVLLGSWDNITGVGAATTLSENFTGDGILTIFVLTNAPFNQNAMDVFINGVYQQRNTYSLTDATITFSEAPPKTSSIEVLFS
jgi:hypothetical protein